jgi:Xaa-Pro aminopeptidase
MQPDLSPLDAALGGDADGYLLDADGTDSTQRYLSGFDAPDPFVTCYTPGGVHLLVSGLEYGRAGRVARADTVTRFSAYDYRERVTESGRATGRGAVVADFLADHGVDEVVAPGRFPLGTADGLRDAGVTVRVDETDAVAEIRAVKTDAEVEHVRRTQRANERAMAAAESLLESASVVEGVLHRDGDPLTSEAVRREIELTLVRQGCALDETIVACGADAADPHDRGSGPLRADEPIVVDIFPRDTETRYHADMTRTFLKGTPDATLREWFDLTDEARRAALDAVEPGVTGAAVHDAVCDVYEAAGLPTLRSKPDAETGFIHSTGHGVGLDVHELPRIAPDGGELEPGNVVTIEPGLYDPDVGGVRIEDLIVVTDDGYENLTEYPVELVL